jgi:adenylate cyclase class 2
MNTLNIEIEAHFIDVDVHDLHKKLMKLGAEDLGEDFLHELIVYDKDLEWKVVHKFVRLRENSKGLTVAFKHFQYEDHTSKSEKEKPEVKEIEFRAQDWDSAVAFLEAVGLRPFREQEKKRHSYKLGEVIIDIDMWPKIPPYAEIEGPSEEAVKEVSEKLGFDWSKAIFRGAGFIINHYYGIPVVDMRVFTFKKIE